MLLNVLTTENMFNWCFILRWNKEKNHMSSLCYVIAINHQNSSLTFLGTTWSTIRSHRSEAWWPQHVSTASKFPETGLVILFAATSRWLILARENKVQMTDPMLLAQDEELWGFHTATVNGGRSMFQSGTFLPPQPLLLFRCRIINVPVLLQCLHWQSQTQKHASPSGQEKTYVHLHDAVFGIADCVAFVKQWRLLLQPWTRLPNATFYSLQGSKGEECDQQWQERETFNESSGCWFTQGNQSQQKSNFNRN